MSKSFSAVPTCAVISAGGACAPRHQLEFGQHEGTMDVSACDSRRAWSLRQDPRRSCRFHSLANRRIRHGERSASKPKQHFASFAVSLLKQKVAAGDIKSQAGIQKWESTLGRLIRGTLGDFYIEAIEPRDVMRWRGEQAKLVQSQTYSPHTPSTPI